MLDKLPAWARHLLIAVVVAPVAGFAGIEALTVVQAAGFSGVDWPASVSTGANAAAVTAASGALGWLALFVTPLTRKYGVGSAGK